MATNRIGDGKTNLSVTCPTPIAMRIGRVAFAAGARSRNEWCRQALLDRLAEAERRIHEAAHEARQLVLPFASLLALSVGIFSAFGVSLMPGAPDLRRAPGVVRVVRPAGQRQEGGAA